jgi:hypothetical protein
MGTVGFGVIQMTADQVKGNVLPGDFPERNKIEGEKDAGVFGPYSTYSASARFPGIGGDTLPLSVTVYSKRDGGSDVSVTLYRNPSLEKQAVDHCAPQESQRFLWHKEVSLRAGVSVLAAYTGDYNADGRTDFYLKLSDGAGIVFQQEGDQLPLLRCHRPVRLPPPFRR